MYSPEKHRLGVFFDDSYHELLDMQSYGHDIEAGWLLWDSVVTTLPEPEHAAYRSMCIDLVSTVHERAWTDLGTKNECVAGQVDGTLVWWVQAETMLGFANNWQLTGDPVWAERCTVQWQHIQRMIIDPRENSEWFWSVTMDGMLSDHGIVEEWKCPYHNGRMCLNMMALTGFPV